ncbi:MAG: hypothetical protein V4707_13500 [Pseudomonadota bacterium]
MDEQRKKQEREASYAFYGGAQSHEWWGLGPKWSRRPEGWKPPSSPVRSRRRSGDTGQD